MTDYVRDQLEKALATPYGSNPAARVLNHRALKVHVRAALDLLDNARYGTDEEGENGFRCVPDPAPRMSDQEYERLRRQFVESTFPAPRGDAEPSLSQEAERLLVADPWDGADE